MLEGALFAMTSPRNIHNEPHHRVPALDPRAGAIETLVRGAHLRASRGLLDWSRSQLSAASGLSLSSIRRLEDEGGRVSGRLLRIAIATLRAQGVRFSLTDDGILSVGRRPDAHLPDSAGIPQLP